MSAGGASRIKVIGIGNEWRGDDAAGLLVARLLQDQDLGPVAVCESLGDAADLLAAWHGAEMVVMVDAVVAGWPPGHLHRFEARGRALALHFGESLSTHAWGVAEALALGSIFQELPEHLILIGVEGRNFNFGQELTAEVKAAIPAAARLVKAEVASLLATTAGRVI
jgi:hydrogenase maturation protease